MSERFGPFQVCLMQQNIVYYWICYVKQESCAIAKITERCTLYMVPWNFSDCLTTPVHPHALQNIKRVVCLPTQIQKSIKENYSTYLGRKNKCDSCAVLPTGYGGWKTEVVRHAEGHGNRAAGASHEFDGISEANVHPWRRQKATLAVLPRSKMAQHGQALLHFQSFDVNWLNG